ncbi:hypothetical protein UlMin_015757 [Ulmus minor]
MGSVWFLLFHFLVAAGSSIAVSQEKRSTPDFSGINLSIHHANHNSSLPPKSYFNHVLASDEDRVKVLYSRLAHKEEGITTSVASDSLKPADLKSVGLPLKPGLSIGSGNYFVKVGLGSPTKYYSMLVDTGSSFSWLQCQPCAIYCHNQADPLFNPSASKTYKSLSCRTPECSSIKRATLNDPFCEASSKTCIYTASYGDASFSVGYLSRDQLTLTPTEILPSFVYGCGQDNQGLFGMAAGILGLARDSLSLLGQVAPKYGSAFSYCLPTASRAAPVSQGGFLSIGTASLGNPSAYKFTPMIKDPKLSSLYFLRLTAITVAGKPLGISPAAYRVPTIIDSGTVITRLPTSLYTPLRDAFVKIMSTKYTKAPNISILDACFKGSLNSLAAVPKLQLLFNGGADLTLGAGNTVIEADKGVVCLAFAQSSGSNSIAIIGNLQQQTYKVAYDVSNSRIGFAPGGCR